MNQAIKATTPDPLKKRNKLFHSLQAFRWRFGMAFHKRYLRFQDFIGFYSYPRQYRIFEPGSLTQLPRAVDIFFSLVIKVTSPKVGLLKNTLDSLVGQSHLNWEALLVLDDAATQNDQTIVEHLDQRIKVVSFPSSPTWKDALHECKGDWIVYLDCGDTLAFHGLAIIAQRILENSAASIIYSDTDCLSEDGLIHHSPSFWPDWSPELLLSVNYLQPAYLHRPALVSAAEKTDDLEDALLRCTEQALQVVHIPQVLCHLRYIQEDPWLSETFKPEALLAHLERLGLQEVSSRVTSHADLIQYTWATGNPLVSIIVLTRDNVETLRRCLDSIFEYTAYSNYEIILVENNSRSKDTFDYYAQLKSNPKVKLLVHNQVFNYSAFNNWGAGYASGDLLLFLNNDVRCYEAGWLEEMVRWAIRPEIGVVGARLLYPNGLLQHAGLVVGLEGHANHIFAGKGEGYHGLFGSDEWYRDYSAVTGACMMLRRDVFSQIGGFDENYCLAFNDVEICLRAISAGYRVVYTPFARLYHYEGSTRSKTKPARDIRLATQHLKPLIEKGDPYYNPNLSLSMRVPTLRRPGEISGIKRLEQILQYEG